MPCGQTQIALFEIPGRNFVAIITIGSFVFFRQHGSCRIKKQTTDRPCRYPKTSYDASDGTSMTPGASFWWIWWSEAFSSFSSVLGLLEGFSWTHHLSPSLVKLDDKSLGLNLQFKVDQQHCNPCLQD